MKPIPIRKPLEQSCGSCFKLKAFWLHARNVGVVSGSLFHRQLWLMSPITRWFHWLYHPCWILQERTQKKDSKVFSITFLVGFLYTFQHPFGGYYQNQVISHADVRRHSGLRSVDKSHHQSQVRFTEPNLMPKCHPARSLPKNHGGHGHTKKRGKWWENDDEPQNSGILPCF